MESTKNILEFKNITKKYAGVVALDNVSLAFRAGEVHALAGENGAGKSTLIKSTTGAVIPTSGTILIDGKEYTNNLTPAIAKEQGKYKGRKPIDADPEQLAAVCARWRAGEITARAAMQEVGMKPNTFYRRVKDAGL